MSAPLTVIIPARNEQYLIPTIRDLYERRAGDIEMFVILDGQLQPEYQFPDYPGLKIFHNREVMGLRWSVNTAVKACKTKYFMKIDAHCSVGEGWDKILVEDFHEDNWIVTPRRYWWDAPTWQIEPKDKVPIDYHYYFWPYIHAYSPRLTTRPWVERAKERAGILLDEDMGSQGSCYITTVKHFKNIGGFNSFGYGTFASEPEELELKTWLGPTQGKVMRNKRTWYGHWTKRKDWWNKPPSVVGRVSDNERMAGNYYCFDFWYNNRWDKRLHDFEWLVERFMPIPTYPPDWKTRPKEFTRYELAELKKWKEFWADHPKPEALATDDLLDALPSLRAERRAHDKRVFAATRGDKWQSQTDTAPLEISKPI